LQAQNVTVKGDVFDEQKQPVVYASVALLSPDSTTLVTGTITDDQGHFQLPDIKPGNYFISLSFIGYKTIKKQISLVTSQTYTFTLESEAVGLDEVTVKANRGNIVKQSAAGQTFHLSASAVKKKDVLDALQEIPALNIDPGTRKITLNDGSKPLILINGVRREGGLSAIDAGDILSVEVVPTSSAEFMHEGYTSVVNIKVKKTENAYTSFNGGVSTHPLLVFGIADASLEFGNDKYSLYLYGQSFAFVNNKSDMTERSETTQSIRHATYKRNSDYSDTYFAIGGDRNWSESDYTSFSATIDHIPQSSSEGGETVITDIASKHNDPYEYTREYDDKSLAGSANIYHKHTFGSSVLDFLLRLNLSRNENKDDQLERGDHDLAYHHDFTNKRAGISFTPSYQFMLLYFHSKTGAETYYQSNKIEQNEGVGSRFRHKQWDEYIYLNADRSWDHFSLTASVGMNAVFRDVEDYTDHYINFHPVLNMSYRFNSHNSLTMNYNMQSTPPNVVQLNPYNTSSDTLSVITGNPYLEPYRTQQVRLSYAFSKNKIYLEPDVRYSRTDDVIFTTGKETSQGYVQSLANQGACDRWSVGLSSRYTINNAGFIGLNVAYNTVRFPDISQEDDYFTGYLNWGLTYRKFTLSGFYQLPVNSYEMYKRNYSSPDSWSTLSYAASPAWDISAGMRYIGWKSHIKRWTDMPGYSYYYENQFTNRGNIVMLGIRYKFQNRKPVRSPEKLQNTDKGFRIISE